MDKYKGFCAIIFFNPNRTHSYISYKCKVIKYCSTVLIFLIIFSKFVDGNIMNKYDRESMPKHPSCKINCDLFKSEKL